ncbi:MAG: transcription antitermination factor NusB [Pseudomonadota bacterium]
MPPKRPRPTRRPNRAASKPKRTATPKATSAPSDQRLAAVPTARDLALHLLRGVLARRETLAELEASPPLSDAAAPDRARAGRLARATLRHLTQADATLKPFLDRAPRADIRDLLRLATIEILVEGEAPHGVVHDAVTRARTLQSRSAGMVNAVLRRVAETDAAAFHSHAAPRLPNWLRGRLSAAYGNARVARMERVFATTPPLDLTLRAGEDPVHWAQLLEAEILPTGSLRRSHIGQVSALPGFAEGAWWVQDAAAALGARLLAPAAGTRVLDLCAAPGGKTLQLADTGAHVTALDISAPRLERLRENLARTGLRAEIIAEDAQHWNPPAPFDAILLDAPCSATGTIRRHPDLTHTKDASLLKSLLPLQTALIERASAWLAPGGRLVLCTCSLLPEEGEALVETLGASLAPLGPDPDAMIAHMPPEWQTAPGQWRITPESWDSRGGIDGFFLAAFRKPA